MNLLSKYTPNFLYRRFWRIYPPYLFAYLLFFFWQKLGHSERTIRISDFVEHLLLIHNFDAASFFSLNGALWSVAVEWQLYLIYPIFLLIWSKWGIKNTLIFIAILNTFLLIVAHLFIDRNNYLFIQMPFMYWLEWSLGAAIAEYWLKQKKFFKSNIYIFVFILIAFLLSYKYYPLLGNGGVWTLGLSGILAAMLFAFLIEEYINAVRPTFIVEKIFTTIGLCSYSIYLFHQPLIGAIFKIIHKLGLPHQSYFDLSVGAIIVFIPILGSSWLAYKYLELSSVKVRQSWQKVRLPKVQIK